MQFVPTAVAIHVCCTCSVDLTQHAASAVLRHTVYYQLIKLSYNFHTTNSHVANTFSMSIKSELLVTEAVMKNSFFFFLSSAHALFSLHKSYSNTLFGYGF